MSDSISTISFNSDKYDPSSTQTQDGCNGRTYPFNTVAGETSKHKFRLRVVSDEVNNIVKLTFLDTRSSSRHCIPATYGETPVLNTYGDFIQAYDPNVNKITGPIGFIDDYSTLSPYDIYQINNNDGSKLATGKSLRWIPSDTTSTLYCEMVGETLFEPYTNDSGGTNSNGGVFFQQYASGSIVSWGSSIESINQLSDVVLIVTREPENGTDYAPCYPGTPDTGYGTVPATSDALIPIRIMYKKKEITSGSPTDPCDYYYYEGNLQVKGTGYIFLKADNSGGMALYVHLQEDINLNYGATFLNEEYFIESVETLSNTSQPCFRYTINNLSRLDEDTDATTFKRIKFKENGNQGTQYTIPTEGTEVTKVYQWNIRDIINGSDPATTIDADILNWLPSQSVLYIRECDPGKPFEIANGAIKQYGTDAQFGDKGIKLAQSQFTPLDGVRFVNLVEHIQPYQITSSRDEDLVYTEQKQLLASWVTGGENLIQTLSKENSYVPGLDYIPGQKVIQVHDIDTNNNILDYKYAFGTVISWEYPDPTNPSDLSPMKLVVKMNNIGPRTPDSIFGPDDYSTLEIFKVGSAINTNTEIAYDGKIIPYNPSTVNNPDSFINWPYEINNPSKTYFTSNKNGIIVNGEEVFSEISETPIPSTIGTSRIRAISLNPNIDSTETYPLYKFYLFDTEIFGTGSLFTNTTHIAYRYSLTDSSNVSKKLIQIAPVTGKEVYLENVFDNLIQSKRTVIFEPNKDKMFIDIPKPIYDTPFESVIGSSGTITFEIQKIYSVTFAAEQSQIAINVEDGSSSVSDQAEFLLAEPGINWFVINRKTGETFDLYESKPSLENNELLYSTEDGHNLILERNVSNNNNELLVVAKVSVTTNINNIKTKSQTSQTEFLINPLIKPNSGKYKNRYYFELMTNADSNATKKGLLKNIDAIYVTDSVGFIQPGTKNIKDLFEIDFGVTDQKISKPKLILKSGYTNPNGTLKSESFNGAVGQQVDPTSINLQITYNLFEIDSNSGIFTRESFKLGSNSLSIEQIPFYLSPNDGTLYHSSGLLDFRPSDLFDSSGETLGDTKFVPHPDWSDSVTTSFYLPRKDRLVLTKSGKMEVIYGIPSVTPVFPQEPNSTMSLHLLNKPAYVFNNKDVQVIPLDNRRYTMKDIGNIDKRVKKLEYYTALNLLESDADGLLITDENGNNRFKSGILVDSFTGHGIGDVLHPDYNIAIDQTKNYARPPFITHNSKLVRDTTTNTANVFVQSLKPDTNGIGTGIYTFPYTQVPFVAQPLASRSISVMPHEVIAWVGEITAFPSSDLWVDQTRNPDVIVNTAGNNDAWQALATAVTNSGQGPFGAHWGSWQTIGQTTSTSTVTEQINTRRWGGLITSQITTTIDQQERTGTFTELVPTETSNSLGDRITDVSLIPFMRSQSIELIGSGLKSNTRMYVFFDEIDVSEHCFNYANEQDMINDINGFSFASADPSNLKTNDEGKIYIRFNLPGSTFRTGERVFQIIDHPGNDKSRASTYAATKYFSNGLGITREQTILTTRDFQIRNTDINETRDVVVGSSSVEVGRETWWSDPLAQTFLISELLHPEGIYIKSVELFFSRKPTNNENLSVSVELRPVNNGYPDSRTIYPGGISRKLARDVKISDNPDANDPSTKTIFEFDYPIYLEPGEHSIVIRGQSEDFEVYIAELGENIINTDIQITNQPYGGVFFTSANSSTWSAEQNIDLMMVMNKCEFATNVEYILPVKNESTTDERFFETLFVQSNYIEFNSCRVNWFARLFPDSQVQQTYEILPNVDIAFDQQLEYGTRLDGSEIPANFEIKARTLNADVCPVIDIERLGFIAINNRIEFNDADNNGELNPYADYPTNIPRARYISRIVTLEEGFESNNCKVILTINKPANTNIQVFGKFQSAYDTGDFHNRNYVRMLPANQQVFNNLESQGENDWREFTFDLQAETSEPFNKFCIKICLYSSDAVNVPKIKNMRAITVI